VRDRRNVLSHLSPPVERVLELLRLETHIAMQQCGAPSIKDLTPVVVRRA
jgi:isopentenyl diphosphate isomerase/L-lactate dehydrogenase-like FMN-dependent dehydrogenase